MNINKTHQLNSHIRQREANDCAVATVATIANLPYEVVYELCPHEPGYKGFYPYEVRELLQSSTQIRWRRPRTVFFRRLRSLCTSKTTLVLFLRQPGNVLIQRLTRKMQHCISVQNGKVFDPEYPGVIMADDYDRLKWIPTLAFLPVDPQELMDIQAANQLRYRNERLWSEITGSTRTQ